MNATSLSSILSVSSLEKEGYKGGDADLAESLFEYGLAWNRIDAQTTFLHRNPSYIGRYTFTEMDSNMNVLENFNWIDHKDVESFLDMDISTFNNLPFEEKISFLVNQFGVENIFGYDNSIGYTIKNK